MDVAALLLRVVLSLGAVLGLVWLLARAARRSGGGRVAPATRFSVIGRQSLGRNAGVAVVRVGQRALVLGVTEQSVRLLAETDLTEVLEPVEAPERRTELDLSVPELAAPLTVPAAAVPAVPSARSPLEGSALSPQTWSRALDALRERTTRG